MISTTHITTGAAIGLAIGQSIPEPIIAIPTAFVLGFVSHHILDLIPHTDAGSFRDPADKQLLTRGERRFALLDNIVGTTIILFIFLTEQASWPMLFGAAGGNFPDVFHHPNWWAAKTRSFFGGHYYYFHNTYHFTARGKLILFGVLTNAALIIGSLWYILNY